MKCERELGTGNFGDSKQAAFSLAPKIIIADEGFYPGARLSTEAQTAGTDQTQNEYRTPSSELVDYAHAGLFRIFFICFNTFFVPWLVLGHQHHQ